MTNNINPIFENILAGIAPPIKDQPKPNNFYTASVFESTLYVEGETGHDDQNIPVEVDYVLEPEHRGGRCSESYPASVEIIMVYDRETGEEIGTTAAENEIFIAEILEAYQEGGL